MHTPSAVIVTGSSGGIGSAICSELLRVGYHVLGVDIQEDPNDLPGFIRRDLLTLLEDERSRRGFADECIQVLGGLPVIALINNAAIQTIGSIDGAAISDFRRTLDVNVTVPFLLAQIFLDELTKTNGVILNIGSIHARLTKPGFIAYASSKAALKGLTNALAVDCGDRVRSICLQPAAIDTALLQAGFSSGLIDPKGLADCHPSKRIGTPSEVAKLCRMLIQEEISFLNGSVIDLAGGIQGRLHDLV